MTDWERAYRFKAGEMQALGRHGVEHGHRTLRFWHWTDDLPIPLLVVLQPIAVRLCCLCHGHTPFTDMDNTTIACAVCGRRLGEHASKPIERPPHEGQVSRASSRQFAPRP